MLNTLLSTVVAERDGGELTPTIGTQGAKRAFGLRLHGGLELLDGGCSFILASQQHQPHVPPGIVDEQEEIPTSAMGLEGDGAAQVAMNKIQSPGRPVLGLLVEGCWPLLPDRHASRS